jgi:SlyX protein
VESRITELEIKLAFQDDLLESLSQTVARQQQQIDLLQEQMRVLYRQIKSNDPDNPGLTPQQEIPPHY